jgi:hypothetical protein
MLFLCLILLCHKVSISKSVDKLELAAFQLKEPESKTVWYGTSFLTKEIGICGESARSIRTETGGTAADRNNTQIIIFTD